MEFHVHLVIYKVLAILASLLIFGQAFYIRKAVGTYIFPAGLMALAWFFYTFIPLVFLYDVPINPIPVLYIAVCILAFSLSALPFNWKQAFLVNQSKALENATRLDGKLMRYFFFISVFYSILFTTFTIEASGFYLESIVTNLRWVAARFAGMRAEGKITYDIYGLLSIFFTYLTPVLGGLAFYQYPHRKRKLLFVGLAFLAPLYFMLVQSAKLVMFYSIGLYMAGFMLRKIQANHLNLFNKKLISQTLIAIVILVPFLFFSIASRNNYTHFSDIVVASIHSIQSYAFAQVYAFADYFSFQFGMESLSKYQNDFHSHGSYTFTSIYNLFGYPKVFPMGTFYDYYRYKELISSNIFTIFRGLINDFGFIGTVVFMFLSGLVAHAFYYHMLMAKNARIASAVFIIAVVYIEGTYLASIFMARYMYLILAALIAIFWINDKYEEQNA